MQILLHCIKHYLVYILPDVIYANIFETIVILLYSSAFSFVHLIIVVDCYIGNPNKSYFLEFTPLYTTPSHRV